ncbi:hypothetical protein Taro_005110 [Colocasia esculenta]|uniref:Uncharacterized protein n=1 Tax=Colocasia esculenta TaxID=4460 RepID=A0A843TTR9_COLES|nr:hypothetical protein [Colocasia esculenta]
MWKEMGPAVLPALGSLVLLASFWVGAVPLALARSFSIAGTILELGDESNFVSATSTLTTSWSCSPPGRLTYRVLVDSLQSHLIELDAIA